MSVSPLRCEQRLLVTLVALIFGPLFMGGPLVGGLTALWFAPLDIGILVALVSFAISGFFAYHMLQNFHWVEVEEGVIRGRKFWTRRLVEQRVADIVQIVPLQAIAKHEPVNVLIDGLSGVPNRGYEIRFRAGPTIALVRWDMTDVDGFVRALSDKLSEVRAVPSAAAARPRD